MVHSVAGLIAKASSPAPGRSARPTIRASMAALVGGGLRARPARSASHTLAYCSSTNFPSSAPGARFPAPAARDRRGHRRPRQRPCHLSGRVQLVAAMNPCRCGHLGDPALACSRAPRCAADYQAKVSGPFLDRIDLHVEVPGVSRRRPHPSAAGRGKQRSRPEGGGGKRDPVGALQWLAGVRTNAEADGELLDRVATPDEPGRKLLADAAAAMRLSARGFHRVIGSRGPSPTLPGPTRSGGSTSPRP